MSFNAMTSNINEKHNNHGKEGGRMRRYFVEIDDKDSNIIDNGSGFSFISSDEKMETLQMSSSTYGKGIFINGTSEPSSLQQDNDNTFTNIESASINNLKKPAALHFTTDGGRRSILLSKLLGYGRYSKVYAGSYQIAPLESCQMHENGNNADNDKRLESLTISCQEHRELVAIKVSSPDIDSIAAGKKEAIMLKSLQGVDGVIKLIDTISDQISFALVLELAKPLVINNRFDLIKITIELFSSLKELHEKGIVHGDIKPHNLLLSSSASPSSTKSLLLADFGNACLTGSTRVDHKGTLAYTPPECLTSEAVIASTEADIYSAGAAIYSLANDGREPFQRINRSGVAMMIAIKHGFFSSDNNPWSSSKTFHNDELRTIVEQCLSMNPKDRPTAAQVLKRLLELSA